MAVDLYFDYRGILLNDPMADGEVIVLNRDPADTGEQYVLSVENSALTYTGPGQQSGSADATLTLNREPLDEINTGELRWQEALGSGLLVFDGKIKKSRGLLSLLNTKFDPMFNTVTP